MNCDTFIIFGTSTGGYRGQSSGSCSTGGYRGQSSGSCSTGLCGAFLSLFINTNFVFSKKQGAIHDRNSTFSSNMGIEGHKGKPLCSLQCFVEGHYNLSDAGSKPMCREVVTNVVLFNVRRKPAAYVHSAAMFGLLSCGDASLILVIPSTFITIIIRITLLIIIVAVPISKTS